MIRSPMVHVYTPDAGKSLDANLDAVRQNMQIALQGQTAYRISLEVDIDVDGFMTTEEVTKIVLQAQSETERMEKAEFVPVAIDARNKMLYQRREDADSQGSVTQ